MSSSPKVLHAAIEYLKGIGPARAETLKKELGIYTQGQLLYHYPFRYIDKTRTNTIADIREDSPDLQLKGKIVRMRMIDGRRRRLVAIFQDETGIIELVWFRSIAWVQKYVVPGSEYLVFGKPTFYRGQPNIAHPEIELVGQDTVRGESKLISVYSSTEKLKKKGLDSKGIARAIQNLFLKIEEKDIIDFIPPEVLKEMKLPSRWIAFQNIHLAPNHQVMNWALQRLKFEEFFLLQMRLLRMKTIRRKLAGFFFENLGDAFNEFYKEKLPFELTGAQKRVMKEIRRDTVRGSQMNRLLQGDVGSGKTVVGVMTMLISIDNGFQACMMAPTEILARQHFAGITELLDDMPIRVEILTGSVKGKKRKQLLEDLAAGEIDILVGTHALIEPTVIFENLGMVIIDEQHRFGVEQRSKLWQKNVKAPHVLVMTATPIPRTLAMTVHGDLDVSVIDELPPGRKPVKTVHKYDTARMEVFGFLREQIQLGRQVYIVYPLIEESETMDYKDLTDGHESVVRAFPEYAISIVHGRMKAADKEFEMQRFVKKETQIMVATTVIEVGVNVPNASVMVIESTERFGLSQMHQLRGRVGRGADQSFCILMSSFKLSKEARKRIKTMCDTNDGFKIAEIDLEIRGPGNIQGTQQSGMHGLVLANIVKDQVLLHRAREAANGIIDEDPDLLLPQHQILKRYLDFLDKGKQYLEWSRIS